MGCAEFLNFDISVRAVRNHRFASTTTSIYIRNFEMTSSKMEGSSIFGDGLTGDGQILISASLELHSNFMCVPYLF